MSSSAGQKVTTDPESLQNPKNENPGIVASDSLAGESIEGGGSFAANSDARGPMKQPAHSLTANTTDTSNATKLDPAASAGARDITNQGTGEQQLNAGSLGKESGVGPTYNKSVSSETNQSGVAGGQGGQAPGYASHPAPSMGDNFLPKGKNLKEGDIDPSAPNVSFTTDIGGKNDPGRAALEDLEARNVPSAGGAGPREKKVSGNGQFDGLDETSA